MRISLRMRFYPIDLIGHCWFWNGKWDFNIQQMLILSHILTIQLEYSFRSFYVLIKNGSICSNSSEFVAHNQLDCYVAHQKCWIEWIRVTFNINLTFSKPKLSIAIRIDRRMMENCINATYGKWIEHMLQRKIDNCNVWIVC